MYSGFVSHRISQWSISQAVLLNPLFPNDRVSYLRTMKLFQILVPFRSSITLIEASYALSMTPREDK